jgi:hypothetical protein
MTTLPQNIPQHIPLFPLTGALLLPHGNLPLNIFEKRYLAMVEYALAHGRYIGMVQSRTAEAGLEHVGCLGRISFFEETDDGRYLINLKGVTRFKIENPELTPQGFLLAKADYTAYARDHAPDGEIDFNREQFLKILRLYLRQNEMMFEDWEQITTVPPQKLVTTLAMVCPLSPAQKQNLLEAPNTSARAALLLGFFCDALTVSCTAEA